MAEAQEPGTVILRWTEVHEWRVPIGGRKDSADIMRAAEEAINASGITHRYGVDLKSIEFDLGK